MWALTDSIEISNYLALTVLKGYAAVKWQWYWGETDGMAQAIKHDFVGCIRILPEWNPQFYSPVFGTPLASWKYVNGDKETVDLMMQFPEDNVSGDNPATEQELFICMNGGDPSNPGLHPFPRGDKTGGHCADEFIGQIPQPPCGMCDFGRHICAMHWVCKIHEFLNCHFGTRFKMPGGLGELFVSAEWPDPVPEF